MAGSPPDKHDVAIGAKIQEFRKAAGLTMKDASEVLGVSSVQVERYESGENRTSALLLFLLSQRFGVPMQAFFEGITPPIAEA